MPSVCVGLLNGTGALSPINKEKEHTPGVRLKGLLGVAEKQWSALFPNHTAIPEKISAPIRDRFSEFDIVRPPGVQMPVPAPGGEVTPSLKEPRE